MSNELSFALAVPAELNPNGIVVRMSGNPDCPLFCLVDVCKVLDIESTGRLRTVSILRTYVRYTSSTQEESSKRFTS